MFIKQNKNGVIFYTSSLLSHVPHAFSARVGGVSEYSELSSMNMGFGLGECDENVRENRRRISAAAEIPASCADIFVMGKQIHSSLIENITNENAENSFECDGFVSASHAVAVKTADCVPILLSSADGRICAAVHAGWRGTAKGIAAVAVEKMAALGADRNGIKAALGASISVKNYRVGDDFSELLYAEMINSDSAAVRGNARMLSERYIVSYPDGPHCDLWELNKRILMLSGIDENNIDISGICTFEDEEFYSHRRQGPKRGVMCAVIAPRK